jgi:hypothetical protein
MATFAGTVRLADGTQVPYFGEAPPERRMLLGMTSKPSEHNAMMQRFPTIAYTAEFGPDGNDADTLPELGNFNAGKYANTGVVPATLSVSWKDDVNQLDGWLTSYGQAGKPPIRLHWWHEPHGDMTPAAYRSTAAVAVDILADHPYRHLIIGFGPVVTRWWMINDSGNLDDWWVNGMDHYAVDIYNDNDNNALVGYRSPQSWGVKIRDYCAAKGISWGVREWGKKKGTWDTSGAGRLAAIRADVDWCAANGCRYMGWWNFGDTQPSSKIFGTGADAMTAERALFDDLFAEYDPRS